VWVSALTDDGGAAKTRRYVRTSMVTTTAAVSRRTGQSSCATTRSGLRAQAVLGAVHSHVVAAVDSADTSARAISSSVTSNADRSAAASSLKPAEPSVRSLRARSRLHAKTTLRA